MLLVTSRYVDSHFETTFRQVLLYGVMRSTFWISDILPTHAPPSKYRQFPPCGFPLLDNVLTTCVIWRHALYIFSCPTFYLLMHRLGSIVNTTSFLLFSVTIPTTTILLLLLLLLVLLLQQRLQPAARAQRRQVCTYASYYYFLLSSEGHVMLSC